jgi:hypothetical protein
MPLASRCETLLDMLATVAPAEAFPPGAEARRAAFGKLMSLSGTAIPIGHNRRPHITHSGISGTG